MFEIVTVLRVAFLPILRGVAELSVSDTQQAKLMDKSSFALAITKLSIPFPTGPEFFSFKTHFLIEPAESWN